MEFLFSHFSAAILSILFVLLAILIAVTGLFLFSKVTSYETLKKNHGVSSVIFGAISLIYSLILAFVIVAVWNDYEELNSTIEKEADKLSSILIHSQELPDSISRPIQNAIREYASLVVRNEWQTSTEEKMINTKLPQIRHLVLKYESAQPSEQKILDIIDDDLSDGVDLRRERMNHQHSHVPGLVWMILITGTIITIFCSYLFFVEPRRLHYLFTCLLTCIIALSLFLVYTLDHPFQGSSHVSSKTFEDLYSNQRTN